MKETKTQTIYDSPRMKVVEVKSRRMLYGSPEFGSIDNMSRDQEEGI